MEPIVLFGIQFTLSLVAYTLIAFWYVVPRLSGLPREAALMPLLWIHAFRIVGGTILAPDAVDSKVPIEFRVMIGYGDLATAVLALLALIALRKRFPGAIALVWLCMQFASLADALPKELQTRFELGFRVRAPHFSQTQRRLSATMTVQFFKAVLRLLLQAEEAERRLLVRELKTALQRYLKPLLGRGTDAAQPRLFKKKG